MIAMMRRRPARTPPTMPPIKPDLDFFFFLVVMTGEVDGVLVGVVELAVQFC
jgi:hypothetical protein